MPKQETVLHMASQHCFLEIVECLTTNGAEVNVMDNNGNTPLHLAAQDDEYQNRDQKLDVVKCIVNSGANISIKNKNDKTVLDIATDSNVIQYLNSINQLV